MTDRTGNRVLGRARGKRHVDSSAEAVFMPDFDIGCQRGKCFGGAWRVAAEVVVQNDASVVQI